MNTLISGIVWGGIGIWIGWEIADKCIHVIYKELKKDTKNLL